jgi:hypothetical protein
VKVAGRLGAERRELQKALNPPDEERVDLAAGVLVFESLKKRRPGIFRSVPVPPALLAKPSGRASLAGPLQPPSFDDRTAVDRHGPSDFL